MTSFELRRFGQIVRDRREDLGLQQEDLRDHGGPSSTTMSGIERGAIPEPSRSTLRKLDAGLNWEPGSAARTLAGGVPEIAKSATPRLPQLEDRSGDPREDVADLIELASSLTLVSSEMPTPPSGYDASIHAAVRLLGIAARTLGARMRREEDMLSTENAGPWMAVYAEQLAQMAETADQIKSLLKGESDAVSANSASTTKSDAPGSTSKGKKTELADDVESAARADVDSAFGSGLSEFEVDSGRDEGQQSG